MKKRFPWLLVALCLSGQQGLASLSKHTVDYHIKARLEPEKKAVIAEEVLTWRNDSDAAVSELRFHLYLNAFKNSQTTFIKESGGIHRGFKLDDKWGSIDIQNIRIQDGLDLTVEYIQPDDGNPADQTVMRVVLPEPVPPQGKITLQIAFSARLPQVFARSGYYGNFFMVAQWFPKIGVLWKGEWNCHQYHRNSEFFADFGVYRVEITVPEEFVVGATGLRIHEQANSDGTKTVIHVQEDVHDFAWAACPDFVEFRERYALDNPPVNTEIVLLVHRSHLNQKQRYLSSLKNGLEFYSQSYGPYPYPTITLVDPPIKALGAGGMEYPTLFTSMAVSWMPEGFYMTEMVTIHEFGHGYWYGIVGSNEFEEAWLDEGINTYSEVKAMAKYYGKKTSMIDWPGFKASDLDVQRLSVMASTRLDPIQKNSWEFFSSGSYSTNSYAKAGLMLLTLENYLGEEVMARVMKTYYERWKFRHPTSQDFIGTAEDVSGQDLDWFFDQFLGSPDKLDYAVDVVRSQEVKPPQGRLPESKETFTDEQMEEAGSKEPMYRNEVVILRKGELIFPQEIEIVFENGETIREKWDGRDRWKRFVYMKPFKLKHAQLDPENKILLDVNFKNNSMSRKPHKFAPFKYASKLAVLFQVLLSLISL